jgi:two-component system, cell cycle response regulator CpdR
LREMLEDTVSDAGFGVLTAASGEEPAELLDVTPVARALATDINLGRARMDGWELARVAREHDRVAGSSMCPETALTGGRRTGYRAA